MFKEFINKIIQLINGNLFTFCFETEIYNEIN